MPNNVTTVSAVFEGKMVNVTLDKNGGTGGTSWFDIRYGASNSIGTAPTREGFTFAGYYDSPSGGTQYYDASLNLIGTWNRAENTTLYAHWNLAYALGATGPGGGKIFYRSEEGFTVQMVNSNDNYIAHYLEAETGDLSNARWSTSYSTVTGLENINQNYATETTIGNGRKNTQLIVNFLSSESGTAAQLCQSHDGGGKNDWFLPSLGELKLLYTNKVYVVGVSGWFSTGAFWTSTQSDSQRAVTMYLATNGAETAGAADRQGKSNPGNVRPIRAF